MLRILYADKLNLNYKQHRKSVINVQKLVILLPQTFPEDSINE